MKLHCFLLNGNFLWSCVFLNLKFLDAISFILLFFLFFLLPVITKFVGVYALKNY